MNLGQHRNFAIGIVAGIAATGAAFGAPAADRIDLSGSGYGEASMPVESFGFSDSAEGEQDVMMSKFVVEDHPEGPNPTAAPLPVSGAMGLVGLGVLASRRRRRHSL